jgi:alcohol dehydrogenase class IV
MNRPERWNIERVRALDPKGTRVWATPSVASAVRESLGFDEVTVLDAAQGGDDLWTLIAVGGGSLIDETKAWRKEQEKPVQLIAIPSIWGSGAEVSPIVVLNRGGKKKIAIGDDYLPDVTSLMPELLASIPDKLMLEACGDVWAHALEGFLSPLASEELRTELADLIGRLLKAEIARDVVWFDLSVQACAGQARSSVGLVHGIAHVLEGVLRAEAVSQGTLAGWSHARLCSISLWPVMRFNATQSDKFGELTRRFGIDGEAVIEKVREFFDEDLFARALAALEKSWRDVLRDSCTRTNSVLVRPAHLAFFTDGGFR